MSKMELHNQTALITGGTSFLGQEFARLILRDYDLKKLIVISSDELEQHRMRQELRGIDTSKVRYFIGNVRDRERLLRAFAGVDSVIHTESQHLPFVSEYNAFEAVKTNILGAMNVIDAAIDQDVEQVIYLSTESSVNPSTLSGLTERTAERVFVAGNNYAGSDGPRFGVARIGSVFGIKTNLVSKFQKMSKRGVISVADPNRSRFWMPYEEIVNFTISCFENMIKGEIFVPKLPSIRDIDLAKTIAPGCELKITGLTPGTEIHEILLSRRDSQFAIEYENYYAVIPFYSEIGRIIYHGPTGGKPCPVDFSYRSDTNSVWVTREEIQQHLGLSQ